jgi:hypothetical protein
MRAVMHTGAAVCSAHSPVEYPSPTIHAIARWMSIVLHPFVTVTLLALAAGGRAALLVALFATIPLAILMAVQVRMGRWTNADASERHERPALLAVGGFGLLALAAWLAGSEPASPLLRGLAGPIALLASSAALNRWLKVSLHVGFATLSSLTLVRLGLPTGWALVAAVPILVWSRLVLRRHTPIELAAGVVLGGSASLLITR